MKTIIYLVLSFAVLVSINWKRSSLDSYNYHETGIASYYADFFEGRMTANGEIFKQDEMTAAHKTLPFGTEVIVENIESGTTVNVIINDRGPFIEGRIIDLSKAAATELGIIENGIQEVNIMANVPEMEIN